MVGVTSAYVSYFQPIKLFFYDLKIFRFQMRDIDIFRLIPHLTVSIPLFPGELQALLMLKYSA
jgi:hypothetical protein